MSTDSQAPQRGRSVAVGLFECEPAAREAIDDLRRQGVGAVMPKREDVNTLLLERGVPEGEARFYANEVQEGHRTLVVADATSDYAGARAVLLRHGGYDVQSRGGDLAAAGDSGVAGGTGPRPPDVTGRWEDVASRYQMLWQQHYGTTDQTWEQMAPTYRFAWQAANDPRWRGRPWSEAEDAIRRAWQSSGHADWDSVAGPIHDVWEDVAEEAMLGAEGGEARRIPSQGADQAAPARDVIPPDGPPG